MDIRYLADHPGHVPVLARWHHAQWGHLYEGWTLDVAEAELRDHACRRTMPSMQRLLHFLEQGLVELEVAAGIPSAVPQPVGRQKAA